MALLLITPTAARTTERTVLVLKSTFMRGMSATLNRTPIERDAAAIRTPEFLHLLADHAADRSRRELNCAYAALQ